MRPRLQSQLFAASGPGEMVRGAARARTRARQAALPALARRASALRADPAHAWRQASRGALLHRREGGAARLSRAWALYRHHRLDLRRAPRPAPAHAGARYPERPAATRDRFALPHAARYASAAEGAAERAGLSAAYPQNRG